MTVVQVPNTTAGATYFVRVGLHGQARSDKGNYHLSAQFGTRLTELETFAEGTLSESDRTDTQRLYVGQTQLFHLVLSVGTTDPTASVRMTLRDAHGHELAVLLAHAGETVSGGSLLLAPGTYTVTFEVLNPGRALVRYKLRGASESDPIGPTLGDSALMPGFTSPENGDLYVYPGFDVPYDPADLPDYVAPDEPATHPPGFVFPPSTLDLPWFIATTDPYQWLMLDL